MRVWLGAAGVVATMVLTGCGRSPQTTFYTLTPDLAGKGPVALAAAPSIAIAAVSLPELVDRPQLVLPGEGARVVLLETHRWAEPLKSSIPRLLAEDLSRLIGPERVSFAPQYAAGRAEYRIFVDFQRFEAIKKAVVIDALWTIRPSGTGKTVAKRSQITEPLAGSGYDALAAAYSRALGRLASEMAQSIQTL